MGTIGWKAAIESLPPNGHGPAAAADGTIKMKTISSGFAAQSRLDQAPLKKCIWNYCSAIIDQLRRRQAPLDPVLAAELSRAVDR